MDTIFTFETQIDVGDNDTANVTIDFDFDGSEEFQIEILGYTSDMDVTFSPDDIYKATLDYIERNYYKLKAKLKERAY